MIGFRLPIRRVLARGGRRSPRGTANADDAAPATVIRCTV